MEYSHHILILLLGFAVAVLALFSAIAVGPYGRRGVRMSLLLVSFVAFLGSGFWLVTYLGFIDQRRAIETRLSELRAQAFAAGSTLACLERTGDLLESGCAQTLFAAPETLAAANLYTSARLDLLIAAARYSGPRTPQFDDAVEGLKRSLQQDPLGLTANILVLREGCTAQRCDALALFQDPTRLRSNIRQKTFDANVARHAASWHTAAPAAAPASGAAATASTGTPTGVPLSDKYTLPSADSIPPVSIMNDEPAQRAAPAPATTKDRPSSPAQQPAAAAAAPAEDPPPAAAPSAAPPPPATSAPTATPQKQVAPRREKARSNAPLAIMPTQ